MIDGQSEPASLRRLRAAAALLGMTVARLAERCGVCDSHLRAVALGVRKPSERLVEALKRELGIEGWAFWRGQRDTLPMPGTATTSVLGSTTSSPSAASR